MAYKFLNNLCILSGAYRNRFTAEISYPGISTLSMDETASLICKLVSQYGRTSNCLSRSVPEIHQHSTGTLSSRQTTTTTFVWSRSVASWRGLHGHFSHDTFHCVKETRGSGGKPFHLVLPCHSQCPQAQSFAPSLCLRWRTCVAFFILGDRSLELGRRPGDLPSRLHHLRGICPQGLFAIG